jgi:hypothetical protein
MMPIPWNWDSVKGRKVPPAPTTCSKCSAMQWVGFTYAPAHNAYKVMMRYWHMHFHSTLLPIEVALVINK